MKLNDLATRMKEYENVSKTFLTRRMPFIVRLDGQAFHTFTKGLRKPFDEILHNTFIVSAVYLLQHIQGAKLAYSQSDEISILITDFDNINTEAYFNKNVQKIVSTTASLLTNIFNHTYQQELNNFKNTKLKNIPIIGDLTHEQKQLLEYYEKAGSKNVATFDSRVFVLPKEEVCNYFIWRQQDCVRNSINGLGQVFFSHKELQNKNTDTIQEMLFQEHIINWNDYPTVQKRGFCVFYDTSLDNPAWCVDKEIPIFTSDRNYINRFVFLDENTK
jgi:tRNA(His) 5'-end guanylyltransferase